MVFAPTISYAPSTVLTIAQRVRGATWRFSLAHARDDHLLIWVTRGTSHAIAQGRRFSMSSHNALFIPARTLFSYEFETTCFGQTVTLPSDAPILLPEEPQLLRVREPKAQLELTGIIESIQIEAVQDQPYADAAVTAYGQLMSVWFNRYRDLHQQKPMLKASAATRLMDAFCALVVRSEFGGPLTGASMAEFAAHLGVTPTHLARVCKAQCGITAADILTQHSLGRARRALENTSEPAVEIAKRLGFSSAAYFTRFITSHTGQTPSALRKASLPGVKI